MKQIAVRSAKILNIKTAEDGAEIIANRSRGTPRIVNRLLRRIRDFAEVKADGIITNSVAENALKALEIDTAGLDVIDHRILLTIIEKFNGGPVGLETLAVAISEEPDSLTDVYEPFLIQIGFLQRTPRGRVATDHAYKHFGIQNNRITKNGELPF